MSLIRATSLVAAALALAQAAAAQDAPGATRFTVRVENVSRGEVLKLSTGKTAAFVAAPVLWAVHTGSTNPIFAGGQVDAGNGLETLAETGNPARLDTHLGTAAGVTAAGIAANAVGARAAGRSGLAGPTNSRSRRRRGRASRWPGCSASRTTCSTRTTGPSPCSMRPAPPSAAT